MNKLFGKISLILLITLMSIDKSSATTVSQATEALEAVTNQIENLLKTINTLEGFVSKVITDNMIFEANDKTGPNDNIHVNAKKTLYNTARLLDRKKFDLDEKTPLNGTPYEHLHP